MGEHETYVEWMDAALEGELPADQAGRLAEHLAGCADCRRENERLKALSAALATASIPVRDGFSAQVMAALPAASWEERRAAAPRASFAWAAALLLALGSLSFLFFALAGGPADGGALAGAASALAGLVVASALAGGGLLAASWSGLGMAVGETFSRSPATLVGFALLVVFLASLLVTLLRRPRAAEARSRRG